MAAQLAAVEGRAVTPIAAAAGETSCKRCNSGCCVHSEMPDGERQWRAGRRNVLEGLRL